jgi:hypothetical protein
MLNCARLVFLARPGIDVPAERNAILHHPTPPEQCPFGKQYVEGLVLHTLIKSKPKGKEQLLGCAPQVISEYITIEL